MQAKLGQENSWGWWGDTALQTHNSKFVPWWSEAEHATSRSRRLLTIFNLYYLCSDLLIWMNTVCIGMHCQTIDLDWLILGWHAATMRFWHGISHFVQWFSLQDVYWYQPTSPSCCCWNRNIWQICHVWLDRAGEKIQSLMLIFDYSSVSVF